MEELTVTATFRPNNIMCHFPTLTALKLYNRIDSSMFSTEHMKTAIFLNPQLRVLRLDDEINMRIDKKFLQFICQTLPKLESLTLTYPTNMFHQYEYEDVDFMSLRKLTLKVGSTKTLEYIPIQLDEVVDLKLVILRISDCQFYNILSRAQKIKILRLLVLETTDFVAKGQCMCQFAKLLPNMTELFLHKTTSICKTKSFIQFIGNCKSLQNVYIERDDNDFESIPNWEIVRRGNNTIGHDLLLIKNIQHSKVKILS